MKEHIIDFFSILLIFSIAIIAYCIISYYLDTPSVKQLNEMIEQYDKGIRADSIANVKMRNDVTPIIHDIPSK